MDIKKYAEKAIPMVVATTIALGSFNVSASNAQDHMTQAVDTAKHNIEFVNTAEPSSVDLSSIPMNPDNDPNSRYFKAGAYQLYDAKGLCSYEAATDFANMYNFKENALKATINWAAAYLTSGISVGLHAAIATADNCIDKTDKSPVSMNTDVLNEIMANQPKANQYPDALIEHGR